LDQDECQLFRDTGIIGVHLDDILEPLAGTIIIPERNILLRQDILVRSFSSYLGRLITRAFTYCRVISREGAPRGKEG
jgi:hypothetical protein